MNSSTNAPIVASMMDGMIPVPRWIPQPRQQPISDERADDPDHQIADQPVPRASRDLAGQPSGDDADHEDHQQALI